MPLPIIATILSTDVISSHFTHIVVAILSVVILRIYSQGRKTNRERDLHGRVILLTGGFTSTGLTLLEALAKRGAHIIALTHNPVEDESTTLIVEAVRASTENEHIFAEQCDLTSPASVREFCQKFLTGQETRLDALVFAHEYGIIGSLFGKNSVDSEELRSSLSLSTFLMVTLLLPPLLVAPPERDIRIITVVNPFYAAAIPTFTTLTSSTDTGAKTNGPPKRSTFQLEGTRALRTAVLTRHLQRVLDALPAAPAVDPEAVSAVSPSKQRSNIVAVCVSPGMSRTEVAAPLLRESTLFGWITYILLQPLLLIVTKSPISTIQTILHALSLPTPFKLVRPKQNESQSVSADSGKNHLAGGKASAAYLDDLALPEEVLKPGALYTECSVVRPNIVKPTLPESEVSRSDSKKKGEGKDSVVLKDDGEMGGEVLGRMVWEQYEAELKQWEKDESMKLKSQTNNEDTSKVEEKTS